MLQQSQASQRTQPFITSLNWVYPLHARCKMQEIRWRGFRRYYQLTMGEMVGGAEL
jgi:hypothetical protein